MSYPYRPVKKLQRSRSNRWIGGVCGGIAEYLNMDPTLVRVLVVVLAAVTAAFPVAAAYFILMAILPESQQLPPSSIGPYQRPYDAGQGYHWTPQSAPRPQQTAQPHDPVWGPDGAPWQQASQAADQPMPPRQSAEDLFSRAKHPDQPSSPASTQDDEA